ncbi:MAG: NAD-dependent epimerase/dehydratase family protein [Planctomycetes bacterium]|nr:NAD-dependent epimerase/dehydratase family protein [Planctomycetota bacterium]
MTSTMSMTATRCRTLSDVLHPIVLEDIGNVIEQTPILERLSGKTVVLTGAGGLLASYLAYTVAVLNESFLSQPCRLLAITRRNVRFYPRLAPLVEAEGVNFITHNCAEPVVPFSPPVDYIIHAASLASPVDYLDRPLETALTNTVGLTALLEFARTHAVDGLLFISSGQIYGSPPERHVPTSESYVGEVDPLAPRSCYDEAKRFGETLCAIYDRKYDVPTRIARPFQVYGPGVSRSDKRAFADFTCCAARGEPIVLRSEGRVRRSFCYLTDATVALWHVLLRGERLEPYNVGCSEPLMTIRELAELIAGLADEPVEIIQPIQPKQRKDDPCATHDDHHDDGAPLVTCPDIQKVSRLIGSDPKVHPAKGFRRTLRWLADEWADGRGVS